MTRTRERWGVVLLNTGSPDAPEPDAVRRYLASFLMDPRIRPLPAPAWWLILHLFILPRRAVSSAEKYQRIWCADGSPLITTMTRLACRVEERLAHGMGERGVAAGADEAAPLVRCAMSYGEPSARHVLEELREAGVTALVALPLYPQSAYSTTRAAVGALHRALDQLGWHPPVIEVSSYGDDPGYLDAVAATLERAQFNPAADQVLFSFHSIPRTDIAAGDTYVEQVRASCEAIAARVRVPADRWRLGFQSPFPDHRTWQGPFTAELIDNVARELRRTFVVCAGFAVDCLETRYDVEQEFRARFAGQAVPGAELVYVPCLNDDADQVALLARLACDACGYTGDAH